MRGVPNYKGKKIHGFTVVDYAGKSLDGNHEWLCRCNNCDNEVKFTSWRLGPGITRGPLHCPKCQGGNLSVQNKTVNSVKGKVCAASIAEGAHALRVSAEQHLAEQHRVDTIIGKIKGILKEEGYLE